MNLALGLAYDQRAQGDVALREGRHADAPARYQTFLALAKQDNHLWSVA